FQAEDGIRDFHVTGVQTCALPIFNRPRTVSIGMPKQKRPALWTSKMLVIIFRQGEELFRFQTPPMLHQTATSVQYELKIKQAALVYRKKCRSSYIQNPLHPTSSLNRKHKT